MKTTTAGSMTYDEACVILRLPPHKRHSAQEVEAAYKRELLRRSGELSRAVTPKELTRAKGVLRLVQEAKPVLLTGSPSTGKAHSASYPHKSPVPIPSHTRANHVPKVKVPSFVADLFSMVTDIVSAVVGFVRHAAFTMEQNGVPKLAIVVIFVVGIVLILHGCSAVVHK
jgi:hypothetical protein